MRSPIKTIPALIFLAVLTGPAWAGTTVKAHLESYSYKEAWVDLELSIDHNRMRADFKGPSAHGSLLYDRESSLVTILDHLHHTAFPIPSDNQAALQLIGSIAAGQMQKEMAGANPSAQRAYALVRENARAFFNGTPRLREKSVKREGFNCDDYVTDGESINETPGKKLREVWITSPGQAGMSPEDYNTLRSLAHLAVSLCGAELTQLGADTGAFQEGLSQSSLPVQEVLYAKGKVSARFKILSIHAQTFESGAFSPPADYRTLGLLDILKQGMAGKP